jgi:hypothetical protein
MEKNVVFLIQNNYTEINLVVHYLIIASRLPCF